MAYKYSKGEREFGDLEYEDDAQKNTKIDFDEDYIALVTSGSSVLVVSGSQVGVGTTTPTEILTLNAPSQGAPTISFKADDTEKATIGINSSENIVIENKSVNKHIVFKVNDQGVTREGFRINGTVPEVVVNEGSESLVDFRVESNNATHMLFVDGGNNRVGINESSPQSILHVNGTTLLSSSATTELLRIAKADGNTREISFENEGADIGSIYFNSAEHFFIRQENADNDLALRVGSTNAVRIDGSTSRVGIYTDTPNATLHVNGSASFDGAISFPDVIMTELSIPGIDLSTDSNAYRFNSPYNMTVTDFAIAMDQHSTSGNIIVTVANTTTNNAMIGITASGTSLSANTQNVTNASVAQGDVITIAITATPANAQGLRASLGFRRDV